MPPSQRQRLQQALIYFGLAEDPAEASTTSGRREWFALVFVPPFMTLAVANDRGTMVAVLVAALFVPGVAVATRFGPLAQVDDRWPNLYDALFVPPIMFAGALLLFRDHLGVWPPALAAAAVSAALLIAGRRQRRR